MAGGIHIFGNKSQSDSVLVINVEHDKEYDLMQIAERFELPYIELDRATKQDKLKYLALIEVTAKQTAKYAIEKYERLRHWKFYNTANPKYRVQVDESDAQIDFDIFGSTGLVPAGLDQGSLNTTHGRMAYVVKLWFIVPKQRIEVINPEVTDPDVEDGLVNPYNIEGREYTEPKVSGVE